MALPLGKLSLIIGAGLVGSILAKEGHMSNMPDFLTGALKIAWKQLKQKDSASSSSKPKNDSLLQQVNSLRQELQLLASNRSIMIVTGDRSGSDRYAIIVVVLVGGYGYLWWKGWRLGDMMFATRRGLNDACTSVAKQLENVYSSISASSNLVVPLLWWHVVELSIDSGLFHLVLYLLLMSSSLFYAIDDRECHQNLE